MSKIAYMFCGGGAQYPGMMRDLYREIPECRRVFDEADERLKKHLSSVCFEGPESDLNSTSIMIPAVYTADVAAFEALSSKGIRPDYVCGFSLGEWAALTASGVVTFDEGISLVQFRSEAMERATPANGGGMGVVLKKSNEYVEALCKRVKKGVVYPANYNYEGQITVSGDEEGLAELEKIATEEHVIYKRLAVNVPSHCALMDPARTELSDRLSSVVFKAPICPIVSNATAEPEKDSEKLKENVIEQLTSPVLFEQTIIRLFNEGVTHFIELGPGKTLSKFVAKTAKKCAVDCRISNVEDVDSLNHTITGLEQEINS